MMVQSVKIVRSVHISYNIHTGISSTFLGKGHQYTQRTYNFHARKIKRKINTKRTKYNCRSEKNDGEDPETAKLRVSLSNLWKKEQDATLDQKYADAVEAANRQCADKGPTVDCALAWDTANELWFAKKRRDGGKIDSEAQRLYEASQKEMEASSKPKPPKAPPADSPVRKLIEEERPCKNENDCELPSGSFLMAGRMEAMFGGGTRKDFEKLFKKYGKEGKEASPETFHSIDKEKDDENTN